MTNTTWLAPCAARRARKSESSSLERSFPSTHMATTRAEAGSFPRMVSASRARAASTWAGEGDSGSRSSGSSMISILQNRVRRLPYSSAA